MSSMKRLDLHNIIRTQVGLQKEEQRNYVADYVAKKLNCLDQLQYVKTSLNDQFFSKYFVKWQERRRNNDYFISKNENWLEQEIIISLDTALSTSRKSAGRRPLPFSESSERTKRRKVELLRSAHGADELAMAASMSLRSKGNEAAAMLIKEVTYNSPERAKKVLTNWNNREKSEYMRYTPEEALSFS